VVEGDAMLVEECSDLFSDMVDAVGRMAAKEPSLFEEFRGPDLLGVEVKSVSGEELEETFFTREFSGFQGE
jgi:hypothetical protein